MELLKGQYNHHSSTNKTAKQNHLNHDIATNHLVVDNVGNKKVLTNGYNTSSSTNNNNNTTTAHSNFHHLTNHNNHHLLHHQQNNHHLLLHHNNHHQKNHNFEQKNGDSRKNLEPFHLETNEIRSSSPTRTTKKIVPTTNGSCQKNKVFERKYNILTNGTTGKKTEETCSVNKFDQHEKAPYHIALLCYFSWVVLFLFGYIRDLMRKTGIEKNWDAVEKNREGYTPLYKSFESFYTRNVYLRIRDAWNRPIASVPGAEIDVVDRITHDYNWNFEYPGTKSRVINMASYNYLGFAEKTGPVHEKILDTLNKYGVGICSGSNELGTSELIEELETSMAQFLNVESCVVFGMGFATNSTNIQCFVNKGCLILSDQFNHASLVLGCRLSGATIRVFKHNNIKHLEHQIRKYIIQGQPKTHCKWKKIIILVEGIYSMEGTIVNLPELIRLKKKYNCYIYLDEAHSIGALGPHGRGVTDYYGCDPNDVDILMGTFTKSFGAAGGYLAGRKIMVDMIRMKSFATYYANPMAPVIAKQITCVIKSLLRDFDGSQRIKQLARNTRYFRKKLIQLGFIVYGNEDSPVVPVLLCFCAKIPAVIRLAYEKGLGFIGAGYPATSLTSGRVRFCISAAHTKEMLDRSVYVIKDIGDRIEIKYSRQSRDPSDIIY